MNLKCIALIFVIGVFLFPMYPFAKGLIEDIERNRKFLLKDSINLTIKTDSNPRIK